MVDPMAMGISLGSIYVCMIFPHIAERLERPRGAAGCFMLLNTLYANKFSLIQFL
jgi:hypothetical protein